MQPSLLARAVARTTLAGTLAFFGCLALPRRRWRDGQVDGSGGGIANSAGRRSRLALNARPPDGSVLTSGGRRRRSRRRRGGSVARHPAAAQLVRQNCLLASA